MLDQLRRIIKRYETLAFALYDQLEADPKGARAMLAHVHDNRTVRDNPVRMDHAFFFPVTTRWSGGEVLTAADFDRIEWTVPLDGRDAVVRYNKMDINRPSAVLKAETAVRSLPRAWDRAVLGDILSVFRDNPLAYDGQNFFDTDHDHPAGKGTYTNILSTTTNVTTPGSPTFDEVKAILSEAKALFVTNRTIDAQLLSSAEIANNLVVITHNALHFQAFELVRSQSVRSNIVNEHAGTFTLYMDAQPASGGENYIEFLWADPGGPKPVFFVIDQDPSLEAWETPMATGYYNVGLRNGIYGVKPAFPQSSLQARLT